MSTVPSVLVAAIGEPLPTQERRSSHLLSVRNCASGYQGRVAVSLKMSVATVAALVALFAAVDIAHAGVGDIIDDVSGEVEETVGDVEEQADELADAADETVADAKETADETVADAKETVDETVADAKETADETVGQVTETANGAVEAVEEIVDDTPIGGVLDEVKRSIDPVVDVVDQASGLAESAPPAASGSASEVGVESPLGSSAPTTQRTAPGTAFSPANGAQNAAQTPLSPPSSALLEQAATPLGAPTMQLTVSAAARIDGGPAASSHDRLQASPWGQPPAAPMNVRGYEDSSSSRAPALPFGPRFPADLPFTAVAVAGAAGSALTVALLCALMLLAPRAGRLTRPGPILARPKPCLSLSERPG